MTGPLFLQTPNSTIQGQNFELVGEDGNPHSFVAEPPEGSGGGGAGSSYVWQDGGTSTAPNVYTSWATLYAAYSGQPGAKSIVCDGSANGGLCTVTSAGMPAGGWNVADVTFRSGYQDNASVVEFAAGANWTAGASGIVAFDEVTIETGAATSPVFNLVGQSLSLVFDSCVVEPASTTAALVALDATSTCAVVARTSVFVPVTSAVFTVAAGGTLNLYLFDATTLESGAVTGAGTTTINADGSCVIQANTYSTTTSITILDPTPTFVFRPGGTAGGNVYTTWASLMVAAAQCPGTRNVTFDNTNSVCHITTGTWNIDGMQFVLATPATNTVVVDSGAILQFTTLTLFGDINLELAAGVAAPAVTLTSGTTFVTCVQGEIRSLEATQPFFHVETGAVLSMYLYGHSQLGGNGNAAVSVDAGGTFSCRAFDQATYATSCTTGAGTITLRADAAVTLNGNTVTNTSQAAQVAYSPGTAGNWNPNPGNVNLAMDQLAAANVVQQTGNGGTGTHTVTVTTGNITKAKNGSVSVDGFCSGATAGADTITVTLVRDVGGTPVTVATTTVVTNATMLTYNVALHGNDTLPDTNAHTYSIKLAGSTNNTPTSATAGFVSAREGG